MVKNWSDNNRSSHSLLNGVHWSAIHRQVAYSALTLVLSLVICVLLSFELWRSYHAAQEDAERRVQTLVDVLAAQLEQTFEAIDLSIESTAGELADRPAIPDNDPEFRSELRKRLTSLPYVRALFVVGPDGFITHDTDYPSTPHVSLADRPYFVFHRDNPTQELYIGQPLRSRSVGRWFISVSRRLNTPKGDFRGIVVAAVEPLYFEEFYRRLWVESGTIAVLLKDGTLLARAPADDTAMGQKFNSSPAFQRVQSGDNAGFVWSVSPIDSVQRLAGFQLLRNQPLLMLVTLSEADVMRSWRAHATVAITGASILVMTLFVFELLARRFRQKEAMARDRLEQAHRLTSVGRFAGGIVHDFGNLIKLLESALTLLRPMIAGKPEAEELVGRIDQSVTSGRELVNQLLSFSHQRKPEPRKYDLNQLVSGALPIFRQAAGPRIAVVANLATSQAMCLLDSAQFEAALVNLVLNARDAMPSGGSISIDISNLDEAGTSRRWVAVSVRDEGVGMSKRVQDRAFEPFFTTKEPGLGNGLGLSQVFVFIKQSGGLVNISSGIEVGTIVQLCLPRLAPSAR